MYHCHTVSGRTVQEGTCDADNTSTSRIIVINIKKQAMITFEKKSDLSVPILVKKYYHIQQLKFIIIITDRFIHVRYDDSSNFCGNSIEW